MTGAARYFSMQYAPPPERGIVWNETGPDSGKLRRQLQVSIIKPGGTSMMGCNNGCGCGFGGGSCLWIILIIILLCCCCGGGNSCGNSCGCNNNCGCNDGCC